MEKQEQTKKIGIKYCGGCNPYYDRTSAVKELLASFPDVVCEYDTTVFCNIWLVICGCTKACVDPGILPAKVVLTASSREEAAALKEPLRELLAGGHPESALYLPLTDEKKPDPDKRSGEPLQEKLPDQSSAQHIQEKNLRPAPQTAGNKGTDMSNKEKYDKIMMENLKVTQDQLPGLKYRGISAWDSMAHMDIISDLEETFKIYMENLDVIKFNSYEKGMEILAQYGVVF